MTRWVVAVEMKRSIAIFPIYAAEGKSQFQVVVYSVRHCFDSMMRRYPRPTKILEEISNDQALDILLEQSDGSPGDGRNSPNIPVSTTRTSAAAVSSSVVTSARQSAPVSAATQPTQPAANRWVACSLSY